MNTKTAIAFCIAAFYSAVNAQITLQTTVYEDDVCTAAPFILTLETPGTFCFGNIGPRASFGGQFLGIDCDAGTARVTTYTDNACSASPSEFGPDFEDCLPVAFNSIRLTCDAIPNAASTNSGTPGIRATNLTLSD